MTEQPTALRLADVMEDIFIPVIVDRQQAAAELRRLHEENTKLWGWYHDAEQRIAILEGRTKGETK
jgi:hypothetical protein